MLSRSVSAAQIVGTPGPHYVKLDMVNLSTLTASFTNSSRPQLSLIVKNQSRKKALRAVKHACKDYTTQLTTPIPCIDYLRQFKSMLNRLVCRIAIMIPSERHFILFCQAQLNRAILIPFSNVILRLNVLEKNVPRVP